MFYREKRLGCFFEIAEKWSTYKIELTKEQVLLNRLGF